MDRYGITGAHDGGWEVVAWSKGEGLDCYKPMRST